MYYNHTKSDLDKIKKIIKKLNQRYTDLTKKGLGNLQKQKEVTMDLEVQADKVYPAPDHKYLTLSVEVEIELLDGSRVKGFYNFRNKCWYINKLLNFEKQRTVKKIKGWRYLKWQN